ncbi:hypothetical protein [Burkholderia ubonensis]|uniref:Uncharacterized protein n=1 Tax=Burkholderia ubonensis TaxID=101571 RepID=A0AB74DH63_9BURK|nr:hypothetical protein [Burkholderia ubonensis]PAJ80723.1 hypothetical protein CJO71_12335 [Burkholderia ubonensis]PAJ83860.1 hypothetical protein CJO70_31335 [Burkholderia ubonensis]PAJ92159.1 hypothetical protein CJO69_22965 [Burkholderia ubonensis]PAK00887.1 hypothetical protein CJO68_11340 [Burkholderia ubonensis]PAK04305.1 hypothetical protein CJO67_30210 [Burkholderia ubonensis]
MNIRDADTYTFDKLPSEHEMCTRALERAIASNCTTLRSRHREYRELIAFRRMPHIRKLERALWLAAWQLRGVDDAKVAALCGSGNLATIASMLGEWLGVHATPVGWVVGIDPADGAPPVPDARAVYSMRRVVAFGRKVIDAREASDLELAASYLGDAATSIGADLLIDVLLKRATVRIRYPARAAGT